jgi:hypothetical protein
MILFIVGAEKQKKIHIQVGGKWQRKKWNMSSERSNKTERDKFTIHFGCWIIEVEVWGIVWQCESEEKSTCRVFPLIYLRTHSLFVCWKLKLLFTETKRWEKIEFFFNIKGEK